MPKSLMDPIGDGQCSNTDDGEHRLSYASGWHCARCPAVLHLSVWYASETAFRIARNDGPGGSDA